MGFKVSEFGGFWRFLAEIGHQGWKGGEVKSRVTVVLRCVAMFVSGCGDWSGG